LDDGGMTDGGMTDPWVDVLGDLEMTGVFYSTGRFTEPWGIELPPLPRTLMFHLLLDGRAVVEVEGETHELGTGDLLLVPHGSGHRIVGPAGAPARSLWDVEREPVGDRYEHMVIDGGGRPATLACGAVGFADPAVGRLLAGLPSALRPGRGGDDAWLRAAVEAIGREARHPRPGTDVVTARLADVVLVHAVRGWLEEEDPTSGWVAALRDPAVGPALQAVHRDPGAPWRLEALAREARMSRSAFAERFTAVVGEAPMTYVAGWRMDVAARLLHEPGAAVAAVARRVGYDSAPGFHRAFVRRHGVTPGVWQRTVPPRRVEDMLPAETIPG
jgi:AraC-like DNA-binding protein